MQEINLFVYGSLKKGYSNHKLLADIAKSIQEGTIKGTMYDIKMGFPAVQLKGNYTIHGQVVKMDKQYLEYFDYFEGVPRLYQRQNVKVNVNGQQIDAFIYTMRILPMGASIIGSGNW